jgi:FKBP-type peptidyl-prolyl cis-trans isomerase 2
LPVKKGDKIKVEYTGKLDDGTVFDSSEKHGEPLEFEVGSGQVIPGFDDAVTGMKKGEEKEFRLEPDEAYGPKDPNLVKALPKSQLPKDQEVKAGMMFIINLPNGMQIPATVVEVTEQEVTLDLNHPMAGEALNFKIKVVEITS